MHRNLFEWFIVLRPILKFDLAEFANEFVFVLEDVSSFVEVDSDGTWESPTTRISEDELTVTWCFVHWDYIKYLAVHLLNRFVLEDFW